MSKCQLSIVRLLKTVLHIKYHDAHTTYNVHTLTISSGHLAMDCRKFYNDEVCPNYKARHLEFVQQNNFGVVDIDTGACDCDT